MRHLAPCLLLTACAATEPGPEPCVACALTDGPSGIRPGDVPGDMLAQLAGALVATPLFDWMVGIAPAQAPATAIAPAPALSIPVRQQAG